MRQSFTSFDSFRRDLQPSASKTDYRKFLSQMQQNKNSYDTNISHAIEHNKRVIAYKNREQGLRSRALKVNEDHQKVQTNAIRSMKVHEDLQ